MFGSLLRALFVAVIVLAITGCLGLFVMAGIAATNNVKSVPIPNTSTLTQFAASADYMDAYQAPLEFNGFRDIDRVAEFAFHKGDNEIFRGENEVAYTGKKWGINYHVSYLIVRELPYNKLYVITAADIKDPKTRRLLPLLKFVHRKVTPFRLDRMAQLAPD